MKMDGTLRRAMAIMQPGMFLSQPAMVTRPSIRSPKVTTSMESAITSRLTRDAFIPSVPMEMPSLTVMVPNSNGVPLDWRMPSLAAWAKRDRWTLQGVTSLARLAMATKGLSKSSWVRPMASSMARAGARSAPWVTSLLRCFIRATVAASRPDVSVVVCVASVTVVTGASSLWLILQVSRAIIVRWVWRDKAGCLSTNKHEFSLINCY